MVVLVVFSTLTHAQNSPSLSAKFKLAEGAD